MRSPYMLSLSFQPFRRSLLPLSSHANFMLIAASGASWAKGIKQASWCSRKAKRISQKHRGRILRSRRTDVLVEENQDEENRQLHSRPSLNVLSFAV